MFESKIHPMNTFMQKWPKAKPFHQPCELHQNHDRYPGEEKAYCDKSRRAQFPQKRGSHARG
jgi:hypothetical protein